VLPLFFFSSVLFPVPDLPGAVRLVVQLNPLSYGVDGLRGVLTSSFVFGVATDFAVLGGPAAILLAIGECDARLAADPEPHDKQGCERSFRNQLECDEVGVITKRIHQQK
jgi:ABC-2 type transporter